MDLNRADMKLLIETGYSCTMRGIPADSGAIFEAIDTWMPDYAAGPIGKALRLIVAGDFEMADAILAQAIASRREGRAEARSIRALCKALRDEWAAAAELAEELSGEGGHAEAFAQGLVDRTGEAGGTHGEGMHGPARTAPAVAG
jgi:hypothetical protein